MPTWLLACGLRLVAFGFDFLWTAFGSFDVEKMQPLWHKAHVKVKMCKKRPHVRTTFGSCDVEKVHAVVARSTFRSQSNMLSAAPCTAQRSAAEQVLVTSNRCWLQRSRQVVHSSNRPVKGECGQQQFPLTYR